MFCVELKMRTIEAHAYPGFCVLFLELRIFLNLLRLDALKTTKSVGLNVGGIPKQPQMVQRICDIKLAEGRIHKADQQFSTPEICSTRQIQDSGHNVG